METVGLPSSVCMHYFSQVSGISRFGEHWDVWPYGKKYVPGEGFAVSASCLQL